ncbi:site-specific DNA-methyltransferase [Mesorhizobium sp. RP14(2022)]|uniref:site-specific DNA-methyltransferase (adenine-specific) n=1 Tax=Mesorhizobium liriopis TaxID=2953882 RepID=A0ABT1C3T1_9HYPH|nr:site-specific DNA-methyltransferase [Mesorhizobium liriopis]MCO6049480.1 site-specific DNA-methyltransferase [Mesorhizobium liriopis]
MTWIGKNARPRPETRSLRALEKFGKENHADNQLIFGDNLLALKALAPEFHNRVRCAFIDPPYNTGSAFEHYDDGLEHSLWLSFMRDRIELIRDLLSPDGSLWIAIDDHEGHYLKVLCDEIFGRRNFVANVVWQKRISPEARLQLGAAHDTILVYARDKARLRFNPLPLGEKQRRSYRNADGDRRGPWVSTDFTAQGWRPNQMYPITTPAGIVHQPP